jgi:hypothetical protein
MLFGVANEALKHNVDISEGPQEIDPRWNELKKILDNN